MYHSRTTLLNFLYYILNFYIWANINISKNLERKVQPYGLLYSSSLQFLTGKYREIQGKPCNENRVLGMRTGFPCNESRFSLWVLTFREFPVSYTGFGFAVQFCIVFDYLDNPDSSNPLASGFVASSCTVESLYM